tara:strand:- start:1893 stop:2870 length:978 start_codon:yes stop_codon:yes gene_type:complete
MKILVTGSEGSLMQNVIPKLIANGHEVIGVDNLSRHMKRSGIADPDSYEFHKVDLTNKRETERVFASFSPTVVIQAAAKIYGVGGFHKYGADILSDDLAIQRNCLNGAKSFGVKSFHYISSSMVYESCPMDHPVREFEPDAWPAPKTCYGLSKYVGERMVQAYNDQYDLPYTIWRPFNIITPHEVSEGDLGTSHVFADFIKHIVVDKMKEIPIIGDGKQIRCFTWIDDVGNIIADNAATIYYSGMTYNVGNTEPINMLELASIIASEALDLGLISDNNITTKSVRSYADDVRYRVPNIEFTQRILGFKPTKTTRESVRECLRALV